MNATTLDPEQPTLLDLEYDQIWSGPTGPGRLTRTSEKWSPRRGTFRELVQGVSADKARQLGGLFGTTSDPGGRKSNETILTRQCIELDADKVTPEQATAMKARIRDSGVAAHWHTTASHTEANPRYRFRFPVPHGIRSDKYEGWALAVMDWLGGRDLFDVAASKGMSQFMYLMDPDAVEDCNDTARCVLDVVTPVKTLSEESSPAELPPVGPATRATRLEAYGKLLDLRDRVTADHPDGTDVYGLLSDGVKEEGVVNLIILFRFALAGDFGDDGREAVLSELRSVVRPGYFEDRKSGQRLVDTSWAKAEEAGGQHPNGTDDFERYEGDGAALFVDLAALMSGNLPPAPPRKYGTRNDGQGLFYSGCVNMIFGDPESGKTWLALKAGAEALKTGGKFAFLDLDHNGAALTVGRLRDLGIPDETIGDRDCFRYVDPEDKPALMAVVDALAEWKADIVLADSVGELLPLLGASSNSDDEYTTASRATLGVLANGGATVIAVDHMAKNGNSRAQGQTGAMAKKRATNGSSIRVEVEAHFTPGVGGRAKLKVNKDRNGKIREACPVGDREPWAGNLVMKVDDTGMTLVVYSPTSDATEPPLVSFARELDESFTALDAARYLWTVVASESKPFPKGDEGTNLKKQAIRDLEGLVRSGLLLELDRPEGSKAAREWYLPNGR